MAYVEIQRLMFQISLFEALSSPCVFRGDLHASLSCLKLYRYANHDSKEK